MSFNSLNKVTLLGRLGKDPEIRMTSSNKKIATFSIATSKSWIDKTTKEKKEITDWHNIVIFHEPTAKFVESYVKKGSKVYVEGLLRTRKWSDNAGNERYSTEVIVSGFDGGVKLLDSPNSEARMGTDIRTAFSSYGDIKRGKDRDEHQGITRSQKSYAISLADKLIKTASTEPN